MIINSGKTPDNVTGTNPKFQRNRLTPCNTMNSSPDTKLISQELLFEAVKTQNQERAAWALELGASASKELAHAASTGNDTMVKLLIEAGADLNHDAGSALDTAHDHNHASTIKLLLDSGADPFTRRSAEAYRFDLLQDDTEGTNKLKADTPPEIISKILKLEPNWISLATHAEAFTEDHAILAYETQAKRTEPNWNVEDWRVAAKSGKLPIQLLERIQREDKAPTKILWYAPNITPELAERAYEDRPKDCKDTSEALNILNNPSCGAEIISKFWEEKKDQLESKDGADLNFNSGNIFLIIDPVKILEKVISHPNCPAQIQETIVTWVLDPSLAPPKSQTTFEKSTPELTAQAAAAGGHTKTLQRVLESEGGANIDSRHLLRNAIKHGHTQTAEMILNTDPAAGKDKALQRAVLEGHYETVKMLLKTGADIRVAQGFPLLQAVRQNHEKTVMLLLEGKIDIRTNEHATLRSAKDTGSSRTYRAVLAHYKTSELRTLLGKKEFPQDLLQKEIQTRNSRAAQKAKRIEPEIEI